MIVVDPFALLVDEGLGRFEVGLREGEAGGEPEEVAWTPAGLPAPALGLETGVLAGGAAGGGDAPAGVEVGVDTAGIRVSEINQENYGKTRTESNHQRQQRR